MEANNFIDDLLKEKDAAYAIYYEKLKQISQQMMNQVFITTSFIEEPGIQESPLEGKILVLPQSTNSHQEDNDSSLKLLICFKFSTSNFSRQDSKINFVKPSKVELSAFLQKTDPIQLLHDISKWENIKKFPLSQFSNIEEIVSNALKNASNNENLDSWNHIGKSKARISGMNCSEKDVFLHDSFIKATSNRMVELWNREKLRFSDYLPQVEQQILALNLQTNLSHSNTKEKKAKI